jgi:3-oxoacyl-[acyl-carrier-protein] synthase-3
MGIQIVGTGSYLPEKKLTNLDLEKIVDTNDEWITTRTGIKERRIAGDDVATSDLATQAALNAIKAAGISPEEIDLITVASITGDKIFPSTACFVQSKIGAKNAVAFDLQAACSGLLYSMEVVNNMLKGGNYKTALIIGAEKLTSIVDWEDRSTCVLFGDGAAAVILQNVEDTDDCIIASDLGADGNYTDILHIPAGGSAMGTTHETIDNHEHFLKMGGQEVFKLAVTAMSNSCKKVIEKANLTPDDIKWLVPHQANYRILKAVATRVKIPEDRVFMNVDKYGNTSAASIGICLDEMVQNNKIQKGDYALLTAFGGGLTWGALLIKW